MTFLNSKHCFIYLLFVVGVLASPARSETLQEAVQAALVHHPAVESARAGVDAATQSRREEVSGYFPTVSITGTGGRLFGDNSTSRGLSVTRGDGYSYLWEGSITARQMLFDGFETPNRVESAEARKMSAGMDLRNIREGLSMRATSAYLDVMRARTGLRMLKKHEKKVLDYLSRIKNAVDEGAADEAEHQQARDVKVILDGFIDDYEGQVSTAEAAYLEAIGKMPDGDMEIPQPQIELIPQNLGVAIESAKESHPSLQSAEFTSQSVESDIGAEQASLYPNIDGELSYLESDKDDIIGGEVRDGRAVVRLNWEFETGGAQLARIKRKRYEHQEALGRLNDFQRQIERDVRLAYSELKTAQKQLANQKKREELNSKLFETYEVQFEGARISLLQLMQADNQVFNTKLEKMNGAYRVLTAQYGVLASMGRLQDALVISLSDAGPLINEQE